MRTALMIAFLVATPCHAQTGPSFDCAAATSSIDVFVCRDASLAALDRRLAARFEAALVVARIGDSEAALHSGQQEWTDRREGCHDTANIRHCIEHFFLRREGALVATYLLEPPTRSETWSCDGDPAGTLVVRTFATELPAVRLDYAGTIDTGSLVNVASGPRYITGSNHEFRPEGDVARLIWPQGHQHVCRISR